MIDHVSIPVRNLDRSLRFYTAVLSILGFQFLAKKEGTAGYGKKYPEFWINQRTELSTGQLSDGFHVCLRAKSVDMVKKFCEAVIEVGGQVDGEPGYRKEYTHNHYAAFIVDLDGNRIEAVTFTEQ